MKKTNETVACSADEMNTEAEDRTGYNQFTASCERQDEWEEFLCGKNRGKSDADYAARGVFEAAILHFRSRCAEALQGRFNPYNFAVMSDVAKILSFDFTYSYDEVEWDGKTFDKNDDDAFEVASVEFENLDLWSDKIQVLAALAKYLRTMGAQAKRIGSASYPLWRKLLIEYTCEYDFNDGEKLDEAQSFCRAIAEATRILWADGEFQRELEGPKTAAKRPRRRRT